jgi:uncharacterized damage-inducible protein DinB
VGTDEHGRVSPPHAGSEAATLTGFLDYQRATLAWKCAGLTDEQLQASLPPTSMTLGGLLKHCARAEDHWFAETVGRAYACEPWASADPDGTWEWEWVSAARDSGEALRALWADRVARARAVVAAELAAGELAGLGRMHPAWGGQDSVSLRWVLVHMIEEYARHNGHADLLREALDGSTGE